MLVIELGLNPSYVMDEMQLYEIKPLIKHSYLKRKEQWEQTRFIAYLIAQVNSKKKIKPTDILSFGWEKNEDKISNSTAPTKEEIEKLKQEAIDYQKRLKNK